MPDSPAPDAGERDTLTEAERELLGDWWDSDWPDTQAGAMGTLYEAVERILAARHAALTAEVERLRETVGRVRQLHSQDDSLLAPGKWCHARVTSPGSTDTKGADA